MASIRSRSRQAVMYVERLSIVRIVGENQGEYHSLQHHVTIEGSAKRLDRKRWFTRLCHARALCVEACSTRVLYESNSALEMSVARERRTYRVQQLPPWLQLNQVADFLVAACACIGLAENIKAHSIAKSLSFVSLVARTVQVATITFTKTPLIFDDDEEQWSIPGEHDRWSRNIIFDVHFRGFTALNDTSSNEQQLE